MNTIDENQFKELINDTIVYNSVLAGVAPAKCLLKPLNKTRTSLMFLSIRLTSIMLRNLRKPWEYDQCPQLFGSKTNKKQKDW